MNRAVARVLVSASIGLVTAITAPPAAHAGTCFYGWTYQGSNAGGPTMTYNGNAVRIHVQPFTVTNGGYCYVISRQDFSRGLLRLYSDYFTPDAEPPGPPLVAASQMGFVDGHVSLPEDFAFSEAWFPVQSGVPYYLVTSGSDSLTQKGTFENTIHCDLWCKFCTCDDEAIVHGACTQLDDESAACLQQDRFEVRVSWKDFSGNSGSGRVAPFGSSDSANFWFFDPNNWELLVKVLDGCGINDHFWVFAAATTNVEYTLHVRDTETGAYWSSTNPLGTSAAAITDTTAFPCGESRLHLSPR